LWLLALLVLTSVGLVATRIIDLREGYDPLIKVPPDTLPGIWARWDSTYYVVLAAEGYAHHPDKAGFFPLFPFLMAAVARLFGLNETLSGMLIAQGSFLVALLGFYKLARQINDSHSYAMRGVLYLLLFPTSFFFYAVYAESLYLAFSIWSAYFVLRKYPNYVAAGLASGIASLARPIGWLLNVILLAEFVARRKFTWSSFASVGIGITLSGVGVIGYVYYLYTLTGTFLAIPIAQAQWLRHWQYPWLTYWQSLAAAFVDFRQLTDWFLYVINWVDLGFTTFALVLTVFAVRMSLHHRFRWSLTLYLCCALLFLLSMAGPAAAIPLWAMSRWIGSLFPLFLVMAQLTESRIANRLMLALSGAILIVFTAWWASGRWVA